MIRGITLVAASAILHLAAPTRLGNRLPLSHAQQSALLWYLKWAVTSWAVFDINSILNRWAENRWIWKSDSSGWDWKKEIAVVTGGSGGIGACVVKQLVTHGIRCVVLDLAPLSDDFTLGEQHVK